MKTTLKISDFNKQALVDTVAHLMLAEFICPVNGILVRLAGAGNGAVGYIPTIFLDSRGADLNGITLTYVRGDCTRTFDLDGQTMQMRIRDERVYPGESLEIIITYNRPTGRVTHTQHVIVRGA
jgi:hypothetical protein